MPQFEMLVLDPGKKTRCENAISLLYAVRSFSRLWTTPQILEAEFRISDGSTSLTVRDQSDRAYDTSDLKRGTSRAYTISLAGEFDAIERMRLPLVEFMNEQKFEHRYITIDEVSQQIACELYPYLYSIENMLRGYLTRFMTTRFGGTWWKLNASKEMDDKAKLRKKNEQVFGKLIDNSAFLIDFDELGELIYEQTAGLLTREDIENRVMHLPENADAIKALKNDLQSNYHRFFKTAFADRDFKSKWTKWESLRNKVAHTNLFTNDDLLDGKKLADELIAIISEAEQSPEQPTVTQGEREAIQEQVIARSAQNDSLPAQLLSEPTVAAKPDDLTEKEFLSELQQQEEYYSSRPNGFVGLVRFLRFHLTDLGHDEYSARSMLQRLQRENKIEVYHVDNPYDNSTRTAALRTVK